jgi:hypothetical protein
MKRILLIAAAGFLMLTSGKAQTKGRESTIGLGLDAVVPVGDYKNVADYGLGISLLYQKPVTENLNITGNVGYLRFHGPAVFNNIKYKEGYVPMKAGARYFVIPGLYGAGELGVAIPTANGYGSGTAFIYAPSLGTVFKVTRAGSLDIGIRYENWARSGGTRSFGGLRAGYNF